MPFALLLALTAIASATLLTYLHDRDSTLIARLCAGVCTGLAALGLVGFIIASFAGLNWLALWITEVVMGLPLLLLRERNVRSRLIANARESARSLRQAVLHPGSGIGTVLFYLVAAVVLWLVFDRAMYQTTDGIFTGVDNNIGDLPFHIAIITGFAHGDNFPPQHLEFAGVRLTYPFIVDFVTALFVRAGASLQGAMFWQNYALALSLTGLIHRFALVLTRDRIAAVLTSLLVLLSGGFGFVEFLREASGSGQGIVGMLAELPHDYTNMGQLGYRWGNAITTLLIPQRGLLLGLPIALVVFTIWARVLGFAAGEQTVRDKFDGERNRKNKKRAKKVRRRSDKTRLAETTDAAQFIVADIDSKASIPARQMLAAGVVAGLLPLVHAHSFVVVMLMGACLALIFADWRGTSDRTPKKVFDWRSFFMSAKPWLQFAAVASAIAIPQMLWATSDSAARAAQFFGWEFGWGHGEQNVVWFWIKNTALFIPLLVLAFFLRAGGEPVVSRKLRLFYLPFVLCFIIPNVFRLSPWVWDNIKVIFYWWVASAPLVALVIARIWRRGIAGRAVAVVLVFLQVFAGGLDVWRVTSRAVERQSFDANGVLFAELIKRQTSPHSIILHAPTYNDPVYLTGRRTYVGYDGHLWSHGIDYEERLAEVKRIYVGAADAATLIVSRGIEYVVVGPLERAEMLKSRSKVNELFFQRYTKVGETGEYRLYKTRP
jgi:hypothetical protein